MLQNMTDNKIILKNVIKEFFKEEDLDIAAVCLLLNYTGNIKGFPFVVTIIIVQYLVSQRKKPYLSHSMPFALTLWQNQLTISQLYSFDIGNKKTISYQEAQKSCSNLLNHDLGKTKLIQNINIISSLLPYKLSNHEKDIILNSFLLFATSNCQKLMYHHKEDTNGKYPIEKDRSCSGKTIVFCLYFIQSLSIQVQSLINNKIITCDGVILQINDQIESTYFYFVHSCCSLDKEMVVKFIELFYSLTLYDWEKRKIYIRKENNQTKIKIASIEEKIDNFLENLNNIIEKLGLEAYESKIKEGTIDVFFDRKSIINKINQTELDINQLYKINKELFEIYNTICLIKQHFSITESNDSVKPLINEFLEKSSEFKNKILAEEKSLAEEEESLSKEEYLAKEEFLAEKGNFVAAFRKKHLKDFYGLFKLLINTLPEKTDFNYDNYVYKLLFTISDTLVFYMNDITKEFQDRINRLNNILEKSELFKSHKKEYLNGIFCEKMEKQELLPLFQFLEKISCVELEAMRVKAEVEVEEIGANANSDDEDVCPGCSYSIECCECEFDYDYNSDVDSDNEENFSETSFQQGFAR